MSNEKSEPAGYVMVPVEPNEAMLDAMWNNVQQEPEDNQLKVLYKAILAAAPSAPATVQGDGWIPVGERLPESECTVLAFYLNSHGKGRRVRAEYFWPAGWYEVMDNWNALTHMVIQGAVTHWMPLPAAPAAQGGE